MWQPYDVDQRRVDMKADNVGSRGLLVRAAGEMADSAARMEAHEFASSVQAIREWG